MISVFISHKKEDTQPAAGISRYLDQFQNVTTYLDVLDPHLESNSDDLGDYLRDRLGRCTHLMAAVSQNTKLSWWVPFEIGLATEKRYPISTYAIQACDLPDYLKKWPYLRSEADLKKYLEVALGTETRTLQEGLKKAATSARATYSRNFHRNLKMALGQ